MTSKTLPPARVFFAFLLVATVQFSCPGCGLVPADGSGGAVTYVRGDLETTVPAEYGRVVGAAREALKELEFTKVSDTKDALTATLVARTGLDKKVEVTLTNSGKKLTSIKIRVGIFGDEQVAGTLLARIKGHL